jgi:hypothetical protein
MSSTIRVSAAAKRNLERLRRRWEQSEGRKLTQEEAAGRAFEILAADATLADGPRTKRQRSAMERFLAVHDPAVSSHDVDEVLYGGSP